MLFIWDGVVVFVGVLVRVVRVGVASVVVDCVIVDVAVCVVVFIVVVVGCGGERGIVIVCGVVVNVNVSGGCVVVVAVGVGFVAFGDDVGAGTSCVVIHRGVVVGVSGVVVVCVDVAIEYGVIVCVV